MQVGQQRCRALRARFAACLVATCACLASATADAQPQSRSDTCRPNPLGKRDLYLRGTFNSWSAIDTQRFTYLCNRFELVTSLNGPQTFKVGDDDWSKDADFGGAGTESAQPIRLTARGPGIHYTFQGTHRILLNLSQPSHPAMEITHCPNPAPPLADTTLLLRGTMNNWAALDDFAFTYSCDAYYLNVRLQGAHEFKIADSTWQNETTLGGPAHLRLNELVPVARGSKENGVGNLGFAFDGEQTIRIAFANGSPSISIGPKSFADPRQQTISDPLALGLRYDSRLPADKSPFGAVSAGTPVDFSISAPTGVKGIALVLEKRRLEGNQDVLEYSEVARLPMVKVSKDGKDRWAARYVFKDISVYGYYFEASIGDRIFVYGNNRDSIYWTREKGSNGIGLAEEKPASTKGIRRFRHTVFSPDFTVPAWARDAVYYYIFPERFRNGDSRNDPNPAVDSYQDKKVEFHANWLDKPYKPGSGDGSDDVYNNDFFGGDIAGIIEKLDYIAELGANALYITPLFRASSNHKYDTADYRNIDPHFGTNADFVRLTAEAAKRGIRVIPDTSLNHTGADSIYFDRFGKYRSQGAFENARVRRDSPYASWYSFDETQKDPGQQYKGWVDVADLPELNKNSPAFRKFAYGDADSIMKIWLDRGAAGWRMDVAPWVPDDFWREWRRAIKQHKPDALTIAETWFDASKFLLGDEFDSTMNYIFRNTVLDYAAGGKADQLYRNIEFIREVYPAQSFYALMNLLSSHDVARSLHMLGHHGEGTDPSRIAEAKQRMQLAVFFQMIFPGSPAIYYGDEVGVTGGEDPYNRATYPWEDKGGKPDRKLLETFKVLIKMRKDNPVLRHGSISAPLFSDEHVIVLARRDGDTWAITATNNASAPRAARVKVPAEIRDAEFVDALTGARLRARNGVIDFAVPALFGTVLLGRSDSHPPTATSDKPINSSAIAADRSLLP